MAVDAANEWSLLEELPVEILTNVLDFLAIDSRVRLTTLNKAETLPNRIFRECNKSSWETIVFSNLSFEQLKKFSDVNLSSLLLNVNAAEVTKSLDISVLFYLGDGALSPLREFRVLERVFMWNEGINERGMEILCTCIPYKLRHVEMNESVSSIQGAQRLVASAPRSKSFGRDKARNGMRLLLLASCG